MMHPDKFRAVAPGPFQDLADHLNILRAYAIATRPVAGRNVQVDESSYGSKIHASPKAATGEAAGDFDAAFYVVTDASKSDVLLCSRLDQDGALGSGLVIAKPFHLRGSVVAADTTNFSWSLSTPQRRTRKLPPIGGVGNIVENVDPIYSAGSIICAVTIGHVLKNGTVAGTIEPLQYSGVDVTALDLNTDSRRWIPNYVNVDVCINGVTRRMSVIGGTAI